MIYIFGRKQCTGCQEAKKTMEGDGIDFKFINLDDMDADSLALATYYEILVGNKTLPVIVED